MPRRRDRESGYRPVEIEGEGTFQLREPDPDTRIEQMAAAEAIRRRYADLREPDPDRPGKTRIKEGADLVRVKDEARAWRDEDNKFLASGIVQWPELEGEETAITAENCDLLLETTRRRLLEELTGMVALRPEDVAPLPKSDGSTPEGIQRQVALPDGLRNMLGQPTPSSAANLPMPGVIAPTPPGA